MRIRGKEVGGDAPVYVIAEAGSNHAGSLFRAYELINIAYEAGANAVKFQLWRPEDIWDSGALPEKPWWADSKYGDISAWLPQLAARSHDLGLDFIVSPFSQWAVEKCRPWVDAWKIASCEAACDFPFRLAQDARPVLVSMGRIRGTPAYADALLHCKTMYPCPPESCQLNRLWELKEDGRPWGISSHTNNSEDVLAAIAIGAKIVEKHFKLDNQPKTPDDKPNALDRFGFELMVRLIRRSESMFTDFQLEEYKPGRRIAGTRP